jgi:hypothetical protein
MKGAVYKCEIVENLLISFASPGPIPDALWENFINHAKKREVTKYIATTIGPTEANSLQRKAAADLFKARKIPVVVVTDASFVRGLVTAVSWLGANIKAVDWPDLRKGLEHLGVIGSQQERAVEIIMRLKSTHGQ